jgi:DNA repair exonuclease SbcCD nuclease subunit
MVESFNFILIKDPHFMFGFRNNVRKHGWERDIDNKITQIIDYATTNDITNILFTGDIFEKSKKKDWSLNQLQQNKQRLKRFKTAGLTVYSNAGNHDYFDGRESIQGTAFGEMVELGLITYVGTDTESQSFLMGRNFKSKNYVSLYGIDYHQSVDKILDNLEKISAQPDGFKIVLMHSNITDRQTKLTDFTYNQLSSFNIDIIGCGHWHLAPEGGPVQTLNGTTFLNPWNLTRVTREYHVKLDEHKPQMIHGSIVKVGEEFQTEFKEINLEVKPFSEAFNKDVINMLQELGKSNFSFFKEVELDKVDEEMDDDSKILATIAEANSISKRSIDIARELIS